MSFKVYLDESGHSHSTDTVVVAGLGGFIDQWIDFDREWTESLDNAGVSAFHMTDFENRQGEFQGWDERTQKRPLLSVLMDSILKRELVAVGAAISVPWFNGLLSKSYTNHDFFEDPYHFALQETLHVLGQEVGPHEQAENIEVIMAEQPEFMAQGRGYYAASAALLYTRYLNYSRTVKKAAEDALRNLK